MILWTIQTMEAWNSLQDKGVLQCPLPLADPDFKDAYAWMRQQMRERLPVEPPPNISPLWAWYQYDGEKRKRPDLRSRNHLPKGVKGIRIEFDIANELVLLSDFELWHHVLNKWYIADSEKDYDHFEQQLARHGFQFQSDAYEHPEFVGIIESSWHRIFNLDWTIPEWIAPRNQKSIQATFWELSISAVHKIDTFVGR